MKAKSIFIIAVTVLVTIVLMKNSDEVNFWLFTDVYVSKLVVMGILFALGFLLGLLAGFKSRKDKVTYPANDDEESEYEPKNRLSDEDRDYIN